MARRVVVEADGGSRGNPGPAGYGAVVRDAVTGDVLAEVAAGIGRASNNVAEYRGLIAGLQAVLDLGDVESVEVRMDSKLVVEQMSGRWQVKHPDMRVLAREAADLVARLPRVRFTHVGRALNSYADRLANEAMDAAARGETWVRAAGPATGLAAATTRAADAAGRGEDGGAGGRAARERAERGGAGGGRAGERLTERSDPSDPARPPPDPDPDADPDADPDDTPARRNWLMLSGTPTSLLLVRHGETELSVAGRFSGTGDPELTARGWTQAKALAGRAASLGPVAAVWSSPLRRARDTAAGIAEALGLDVRVDERLAECDFGEWEGLTLTEIRRRDPDVLAAWMSDTEVGAPGGESFAAVTRRVRQARDSILAAHPGQTVVLVSHVTPIKVLLRLALDAPPSVLYRLFLDLASISQADWYADGQALVRRVNDTAHLS